MISAHVLLAVLAVPITLEEVRAASRQNLDALRAEIELRRQQLAVAVARAPILPQVSLSSQFGGNAFSDRKTFSPVLVPDGITGELTNTPVNRGGTAANFSLAVSVNQLIYDGGRWWNAIAQAGASARAAEGQLEEQRLASELEAVSRFYQLLTAQFSLRVLENGVKRSEDQLSRADSLYDAARAGKFDAINAAVNLGNDRIGVLRQRQVVIAAQVELLKWLGQPTHEIEAVDPIAEGADQRAAPPLETAMAVARRHRPLFQALDAQVQVAERGVDLGWAPFFPSVSIGATYQRQSPTADPFFTDPSKNNNLTGGLSLSWQVFNGFGHQAQLSQARETLSQARLQRERAELDLDGDLRRSLKALETQLQVAQIAADNLRFTEAGLKLAEERFTAGAGSTLEVRDAQVKLTNAQLSRLQARVDVEVARAAVKRVVGAEVEEVR